MTDREGGATFNIGKQQAGAIYQAGRDQVIHHGGGTLSVGLQSAVSDIRAAIASADLAEADRRSADEALGDVEAQLQSAEPNKHRIAGRLEGLAHILSRAGALAGAMNGMHTLASWLGPVGVSLLQLLA
jgi:hypothetical protein